MKALATLRLAVLIFVLNCAVFTCLASAPDDNSSLASKVDNIFAKWDKPTSPGCALAIIKDGEIIYKRGYGMADLEHDIPISSKTVFYIGSTSKQFVAMSLLLLTEQDKLSLDDDIRKFAPEFPQYDKTITIRHLIHHTSGIRDYLSLWDLSGKNYLDYISEDAVLDLICNQKELNFTPGEKFLYSNSGYFLLAVIIKRASGKSLREFAQENIFEPLDMKNSHFHVPEELKILSSCENDRFRKSFR